jgi:polysaccharide pyruvyl transferase WcaK-like protein
MTAVPVVRIADIAGKRYDREPCAAIGIMIVHHYYPQRMNIGDTFIRDAIRRLLSQHRPDSRFVYFPVNQPRHGPEPFGLQGANLDRSNEEADLVVIGGSNLYECRRSGQWAVSTDVQSIRRLKKPVLLLGMGAGSRLAHVAAPHSPRSLEEITLLNEKAVGSSVRDVMTAGFLSSLGLSKHVMTGCPATFLFDEPFAFNDNRKVVIACPPARYRRRRVLFYRLIRATRKYARYCKGLGLAPVLSCQHEQDVEPARQLMARDAECFYSEDTQDYYDLFAQARWVVGYRLHAAILSLSRGIPFIPITFDLRGQGFAATYESAQWAIDATRWGLYRSLVDRTREILNRNPAPFRNFLRIRQHLRGVMDGFLAKSLAAV